MAAETAITGKNGWRGHGARLLFVGGDGAGAPVPMVGAMLHLLPDRLLLFIGVPAHQSLVGGPSDGDLWDGAPFVAHLMLRLRFLYKKEFRQSAGLWNSTSQVGCGLAGTQALHKAGTKPSAPDTVARQGLSPVRHRARALHSLSGGQQARGHLQGQGQPAAHKPTGRWEATWDSPTAQDTVTAGIIHISLFRLPARPQLSRGV